MATQPDSPSATTTGARVTSGGVSAATTSPSGPSYRVSPTLTPDRAATLRPLLRPIGCVRIDDQRFDFDSSFVLPDTSQEFALLAERRPASAATPLAVFGHADPVGQDDYNKELSTRRAKALYGVLVRDTALWDQLFDTPHGGDSWGHKHVCIMLGALGFDVAVVNAPDTQSRAAIGDFQSAQGLPETGSVDQTTRTALVSEYMDAVCVDGSGQPLKYDKAAFLSRNAEGTAAGVPDYQGCGEFNPVLVFSQDRSQTLAAKGHEAERNTANASNRRVVIYVFPEDFAFPLDRWPCPAQGTAGCKAQFWKDGDTRRNPKQLDRQYLMTGDTFACKFYDRIARGSPCEAVRQTLNVFLQDENGKLMPNTPYRLTLDAEEREGRSNSTGQLVEGNVYLGSTCLLEWGDIPESRQVDPDHRLFAFRRTLFLDTDRDDPGVLDRRLHNLALTEGTRDEKLADLRDKLQRPESQPLTPEEVADLHVNGSERPDADGASA